MKISLLVLIIIFVGESSIRAFTTVPAHAVAALDEFKVHYKNANQEPYPGSTKPSKQVETHLQAAQSILRQQLRRVSNAKKDKIADELVGLSHILQGYNGQFEARPTGAFQKFRMRNWDNLNEEILRPVKDWLTSKEFIELEQQAKKDTYLRMRLASSLNDIANIKKKLDGPFLKKQLGEAEATLLKGSLALVEKSSDDARVMVAANTTLSSVSDRPSPRASKVLSTWLDSEPKIRELNKIKKIRFRRLLSTMEKAAKNWGDEKLLGQINKFRTHLSK